MTHRSNLCIDRESPFGTEELFFSTTDRRGVIRYGNEVFARVAQYNQHELVGKAHSIVRHVDMPRSVFRLFWDILGRQTPVAAYVKNRAKDGSYYWVMALATPAEDGYLSVRLKPTSEILDTVAQIYSRVLAVEQTAADDGASKDQVADIGLTRLHEEIRGLGFDDYAAFMRFALPHEMCARLQMMSRASAIARNARSSLSESVYSERSTIADLLVANDRCVTSLNKMLETLTGIRDVSKTIQNVSTQMHEQSANIAMVAINARVAADSAPLEAISVALAEAETENRETISDIGESVKKLVASMDSLTFEVSIAALQCEINSTFLEEVLSSNAEPDPQAIKHIQLLCQHADQCTDDLFRRLEKARDWFGGIDRLTDRLHRIAKTIRFVRMAGVKESAGLKSNHPYRGLFDHVQTHIRQTLVCCTELGSSMKAARQTVSLVEQRKMILSQEVAAFRQQSKRIEREALPV